MGPDGILTSCRPKKRAGIVAIWPAIATLVVNRVIVGRGNVVSRGVARVELVSTEIGFCFGP
ncbi:MAG: hypothetical protein CL395_06560 [Acidiferrobacteraceae bacterium]|nr:hypothetical protein [Acidiferrobacteraceae bacterium]